MNSMHATNKPFNIDKRLVYEGYKAVKSNRGAAGVDEQSIEQFEEDLAGNLCKIWNRQIPMGYRPNRSALDAVGVTRERCWKYDWVLEFDIT